MYHWVKTYSGGSILHLGVLFFCSRNCENKAGGFEPKSLGNHFLKEGLKKNAGGLSK